MNSPEIEEFTNKVRERSDIYSVVSRYVPLTLRSGRYWSQCPFHNENTPSFTVNVEKGIFYCFGCHVGGDVFKFVSLIENITYFEAVKLQAEKLGIPFSSHTKSPRASKMEHDRKIMLQICEFVREFFHKRLTKTSEGEVGRKYLKARGISDEAIETFKIGLSTFGWNDLTDELVKRGFKMQQLIAAGLVVESKNGTSVYDRFRGRVIIPIQDNFGRVVGFGGRILVDDEKSPKYLNSPETEIFKKGQLLFGLDKAHQYIGKLNLAIVVEGYMDAISLVSAGIKNVVASLGTAFTEDQAKLIIRYAKKVVFCYDNDEAGQRATVRALPIMKDFGAEVFVAVVPDGKDPDEFVRKHGKDAFDKLVKNALPVVDYHMKRALKSIPHSTLDGRIAVLKEILPLVADVKNFNEAKEYIKKLSVELLLDENEIKETWDRIRSQNGAATISKQSPKQFEHVQKKSVVTVSKNQTAGRIILRMVWNECDMLSYVETILPKEVFTKPHQSIMEYLHRCYNEDRRPNITEAVTELGDEIEPELLRILSVDSNDNDAVDIKAFNDAIVMIKISVLGTEYTEKMHEAAECCNDDSGKFIENFQQTRLIIEKATNLKGLDDREVRQSIF